MIELSPFTLAVTQVAVLTLGLILMITLVYLARPGLPTLLWTLAMTLGLLAQYATTLGEVLGDDALRRGALGALLGTVPLIWSGLRAWRGLRSAPWAGGAFAVAAAALLVLTPPDLYPLAFAAALCGAGVFAGFSVVELRCIGEQVGSIRNLLPLVVMSSLLAVVGAAALVGTVIAPVSTRDLHLVQLIDSFGMIFYVICGLISLIWLAQSQRPRRMDTVAQLFRPVARARLARVARRQETDWVVLAVQLDEAADLAAAHGTTTFAALVAGFESTVARALPSDADLGSDGPGRMLVLLGRTEAVVRTIVREMLAAVSSGSASELVQVSASVGWAPVSVVGYDLGELERAARDAAARAAAAGGDRWYRLTAEVNPPS